MQGLLLYVASATSMVPPKTLPLVAAMQRTHGLDDALDTDELLLVGHLALYLHDPMHALENNWSINGPQVFSQEQSRLQMLSQAQPLQGA